MSTLMSQAMQETANTTIIIVNPQGSNADKQNARESWRIPLIVVLGVLGLGVLVVAGKAFIKYTSYRWPTLQAVPVPLNPTPEEWMNITERQPRGTTGHRTTDSKPSKHAASASSSGTVDFSRTALSSPGSSGDVDPNNHSRTTAPSSAPSQK